MNIQMMKEGVRENSTGFATHYLGVCKQSKSEDKIDVQIYTKLLEVDSRLGISAAEQLFACLRRTTRWDIIKVLFEDFKYQS